MYTDLYLKFTDEAESIDNLYAKKEEIVTEIDDEGNEQEVIILVPDLSKPLFANIDTIGTIYEPQPDPLPEPPPEPVPYDGWFVNVRVVAGEDPAPLEPFSIDPQPYPMRVWG
jgi:hypothetical protein